MSPDIPRVPARPWCNSCAAARKTPPGGRANCLKIWSRRSELNRDLSITNRLLYQLSYVGKPSIYSKGSFAFS